MGALSTAQLLITANQWRVRKKKIITFVLPGLAIGEIINADNGSDNRFHSHSISDAAKKSSERCCT